VQPIWQSKYLRVLTVALVAQAVLFYSASHGDSRPLRQPLKQFPKTLPGWKAIGDPVVPKGDLDVLKADDVLSRLYVRSAVPDLSQLSPESKLHLAQTAANLFLEYFSTQQQGQSPHSPKNCLPGAGWEESESADITLSIPEIAAPITINKYVVSMGEQKDVVLYWYQSHGRVVAHEFAAKYYLVTDSMRYHRSDTAMIRVIVPVRGDNVAAALKDAADLVQAAYPAILNYFPM
jgi:EpsI family protein